MAFFGQEFHLNDKWFFADRRGKKELMVQLGMNKCFQEENQNLSNLGALYYLNRASMIASVLLMLNSMLKFLKPSVGYFGYAGLHSALTIAFSLSLQIFGFVRQCFLSPLTPFQNPVDLIPFGSCHFFLRQDIIDIILPCQ